MLLGLSSGAGRRLRGCCGGGVVQGRDTRPSSPALAAAAVQGIEALGVKVVDLGVLTTPQLHFLVRACNRCAAPPTTRPC